MRRGVIVRGVGGFYYVASQGAQYECRARGNFRKQGIKPLVGDRVGFKAEEGQTGYILEIDARKNALKRPPVANVDRLVLVVAAKEPKADLLLIDKLMLHARVVGIEPALCVNKMDLDEDAAEAIAREYAGAAEVLKVSAATGEGLELLRERLREGISCFAGQSAVGKSSLINALCPQYDLETGGLSKKTDRGRHTTRHTSLLPFGEEGYVVDTPGFSLLDIELEPQDVGQYYPEMAGGLGQCQFAQCLHLSEPGCAVKESGALSPGRYERYEQLVREFIEKREHKYD